MDKCYDVRFDRVFHKTLDDGVIQDNISAIENQGFRHFLNGCDEFKKNMIDLFDGPWHRENNDVIITENDLIGHQWRKTHCPIFGEKRNQIIFDIMDAAMEKKIQACKISTAIGDIPIHISYKYLIHDLSDYEWMNIGGERALLRMLKNNTLTDDPSITSPKNNGWSGSFSHNNNNYYLTCSYKVIIDPQISTDRLEMEDMDIIFPDGSIIEGNETM